MEIVILIIFYLLIAVALVGCFVHKAPGPVFAFIGLLIIKLFSTVCKNMPWWCIVVVGGLTIISFLINRFSPLWNRFLIQYNKNGNLGAIIGSIVGLLSVPAFSSLPTGIDIIVIVLVIAISTFIMAFAFEFFTLKNFSNAVKSGCSATIVYTCTTFIKLFVVLYTLYLFMKY